LVKALVLKHKEHGLKPDLRQLPCSNLKHVLYCLLDDNHDMLSAFDEVLDHLMVALKIMNNNAIREKLNSSDKFLNSTHI